MKVLFIGGTGIISSACSERALAEGIDLWHFNRNQSSSLRPCPNAKVLCGDFRDRTKAKELLQGHQWDAVVDWVAFHPDQIEYDFEILQDTAKQFVFISSASAYQTPPEQLPVTEKTPLHNPFWEYSRQKMQCEYTLKISAAQYGSAYTIVRPSHTYDKTLIPLEGGYTVLNRMIQGKPVVIHGDGSSLWTLTHHADFAKGLVGLLGNSKAYNEDFHITSDFYYSWEKIYRILAAELGVEAKLLPVPSQKIHQYHKQIGDSLLGDKTHSMIFDNTKIKNAVPDFSCTIPFEQGAKEIVAFYENNPQFKTIDPELDALFDRIVAENQF